MRLRPKTALRYRYSYKERYCYSYRFYGYSQSCSRHSYSALPLRDSCKFTFQLELAQELPTDWNLSSMLALLRPPKMPTLRYWQTQSAESRIVSHRYTHRHTHAHRQTLGTVLSNLLSRLKLVLGKKQLEIYIRSSFLTMEIIWKYKWMYKNIRNKYKKNTDWDNSDFSSITYILYFKKVI